MGLGGWGVAEDGEWPAQLERSEGSGARPGADTAVASEI